MSEKEGGLANYERCFRKYGCVGYESFLALLELKGLAQARVTRDGFIALRRSHHSLDKFLPGRFKT